MSARTFINELKVKTADVEMTVGGLALKVKRFSDISQIQMTHQRAVAQGKRCQNTPMPEWKPFLPVSEEAAAMAWWLHEVAIDPPFSITESLEFAKVCGASLLSWYAAYMEAITPKAVLKLEEDMKNEGEDYAEIASTESS